VRDRNQFLYLARQTYPEDPDSLYKAYMESKEIPHGYFILDFAEDTDKPPRFRTNVFPPSKSIIYATVDNAKSAIELPFTTGPQER
jgi:hypothetical protein